MRFFLLLLCVFEAKHWLADFLLQGRYMLGKGRAGWSWILPLTAHATVHAGFTLAICWYMDRSLWPLAVLDGASHFVIDRIKAGPRWLGRFNDTRKPAFWWALGADQAAHHLVHYYIVYRLVENAIPGWIWRLCG